MGLRQMEQLIGSTAGPDSPDRESETSGHIKGLTPDGTRHSEDYEGFQFRYPSNS